MAAIAIVKRDVGMLCVYLRMRYFSSCATIIESSQDFVEEAEYWCLFVKVERQFGNEVNALKICTNKFLHESP